MCSKTDSASTRRRGSLTKDGSCESCDDRFDALYISYFLFIQLWEERFRKIVRQSNKRSGTRLKKESETGEECQARV